MKKGLRQTEALEIASEDERLGRRDLMKKGLRLRLVTNTPFHERETRKA